MEKFTGTKGMVLGTALLVMERSVEPSPFKIVLVVVALLLIIGGMFRPD